MREEEKVEDVLEENHNDHVNKCRDGKPRIGHSYGRRSYFQNVDLSPRSGYRSRSTESRSCHARSLRPRETYIIDFLTAVWSAD